MSKPGRRPKPAEMRFLDGNPGKRAIPKRHEQFGRPVPLATLSPSEQRLWDLHIAPCPWLKQPHSFDCYMWVTIAAEYLEDPRAMKSEKLRHIRSLSNELGLNPSAIMRIDTGDEADQTEESEFF